MAERSVEFEEVLEDRNLLVLFREFLHSIYSAENLAFWLAAELFKTVPDKKLAERAKQIYDKFFNEKSQEAVNIDDRKTVEELVVSLESPHRDMFLNAQNRIWGLLKFESFPRFKTSDSFKSYKGQKVRKNKDKKDELKRSTTVSQIDSFIKKVRDQKRKTGVGFQPPTLLAPSSKEKELPDSENLYDQPEVEEILDDRELLLAFREFLYGTWASENLAFWLEAELYRFLENQEEIERRCKEIYDKYCKAESSQAINLDWATQTRLKDEVKTPKKTTFVSAQNEIWKVLKNEWFPEFCLSQVFKDLEEEKLQFTKSDTTKKRGNTIFYYDKLQELRRSLEKEKEEKENKVQDEKKEGNKETKEIIDSGSQTDFESNDETISEIPQTSSNPNMEESREEESEIFLKKEKKKDKPEEQQKQEPESKGSSSGVTSPKETSPRVTSPKGSSPRVTTPKGTSPRETSSTINKEKPKEEEKPNDRQISPKGNNKKKTR